MNDLTLIVMATVNNDRINIGKVREMKPISYNIRADFTTYPCITLFTFIGSRVGYLKILSIYLKRKTYA